MKKYYVIFILTILTACSSSDKSGKQSNKNNSDTAGKTISTEDYYFDKQPAKTVIGFLQWYKTNYNRLEKIETVNNVPNSTTYDSTKFYSVNFKGTEKYLSELKKSGFISEKYLDSWRQYFKKCDEAFTKNPVNDGPPEGFDFDFITWSQEYDDILADIGNTKVLKMNANGNVATVIVELYHFHYEYSLSQHNSLWLIDDIISK